MDYASRVNNFNQMIQSTSEHIQAVRDAATKFKDSDDPIGTGLEVAGAAAGGIGGIAGSVAGIQHFNDFKKMYQRLHSRLGKNNSGQSGGDSGKNAGGDDTNSSGAGNNSADSSTKGNSAADNDSQAPKPNSDGTGAGSGQDASGGGGQGSVDYDGGVADRISDLENSPFPTQEANSINSAIEAKASAAGIDKGQLNNLLKPTGRAKELSQLKQFPEGDLKTASQQDFLNFKNKVANDAIARSTEGRPPASGYDRSGNPTGDQAGPSNIQSSQGTNGQNVVKQSADTDANGAPAQAGNDVDLAANPNAASTVSNASGDTLTNPNILSTAGDDADQGVSLVQRGINALQNLRPANVPAQLGGQVKGLATANPDLAQGANMASRLQQGAADAHAAANSATANPNATTAGSSVADDASGVNRAAQGASNVISKGTSAAEGTGDAIESGISTASKVVGGLSDAADVGDGIAALSGMAGPAAPIVALIGGLVSLGTTIAGLFHKKPPPKKEAPPPAQSMSVGANLQQSATMGGAGIY